MFGFFLLSGLVDLISQLWLARQIMKLERAATSLALFVLLLQMVAHIEHKNALGVHLPNLLLIPVFLLALMFTIEVWVPDQPPLWVLKAWVLLVLGSWMLQLSMLLYAPPSGQPWWADSPVNLTFLTIFFCRHLGLGAAMLAAVYGLCSLWHHHCSSWMGFPGAKYQLCPTSPSGGELKKLREEAMLQEGDV
ncbi:transmembrane epididymal protein 1A-like [Cynocephalus volans]|uniref:transmembrane epididymal protein 1A-like n=1 Tax=Cynocephalus volans TaxID=110931 RepID=UPI002FC64114